MVFADDTEAALTAAVALVNSAEPPDTLTTVHQLDAFVVEHCYTGRHDRDEAELAAVRAARAPLRMLLTVDREDAVVLVNGLLAAHALSPQFVRHDDLDYHVHATSGDDALVDRIEVETATAMIDVIRAHELSRLSVCADDPCGGIVLDLSRSRSRRYCSSTCGNRLAVAAYRARRR